MFAGLWWAALILGQVEVFRSFPFELGFPAFALSMIILACIIIGGLGMFLSGSSSDFE
jgi:hypothetical protein